MIHSSEATARAAAVSAPAKSPDFDEATAASASLHAATNRSLTSRVVAAASAAEGAAAVGTGSTVGAVGGVPAGPPVGAGVGSAAAGGATVGGGSAGELVGGEFCRQATVAKRAMTAGSLHVFIRLRCLRGVVSNLTNEPSGTSPLGGPLRGAIGERRAPTWHGALCIDWCGSGVARTTGIRHRPGPRARCRPWRFAAKSG